MKITVFTGNQPRHLAMIARLASISEVTFAIMECNTVMPGMVEGFFRRSAVMQRYFRNVIAAEQKFFGSVSFVADGVRPMVLKEGDLNLLHREHLAPALESDVYVVFGASYIKGWLIDFLVQQRAVNIHMGLSPYYRGSSCNFWALYDGRPEYVGATIHMLSKGLDSGDMLWHVIPKLGDHNPFEFTMRSVDAAQRSLIQRIADGSWARAVPQPQDRSSQIRYTRNSEFTDEVAEDFLARQDLDNSMLARLIACAPRPVLIDPYEG